MLQHIEKSRTVTMIKENIEEEESSLDDSDIYAGWWVWQPDYRD